MHVKKDKLKLLLFPLTLWSLLAGLGVPFSRWQWVYRGGTQRFNIYWVGVAALVVSSCLLFLLWRKTHRVSRGQWLWFGAPYAVSFLLIWEAGRALRASWIEPSIGHSLAYACWSCAFVALIFLWIVGFPYEEVFGPQSRKTRRTWKIILCTVAAGIAGLALQHSLQIIHQSQGGDFGIGALQFWMQKVTVMVYLFLTARIFLPMTITLFRATFETPGSIGQA